MEVQRNQERQIPRSTPLARTRRRKTISTSLNAFELIKVNSPVRFPSQDDNQHGRGRQSAQATTSPTHQDRNQLTYSIPLNNNDQREGLSRAVSQ
jgi:hypothetical protein